MPRIGSKSGDWGDPEEELGVWISGEAENAGALDLPLVLVTRNLPGIRRRALIFEARRNSQPEGIPAA